MKKNKYKIPVIWQSWALIEIEAEDIDEAINIAENSPLPDNGEYVEGSFEVDHDGLELHNPDNVVYQDEELERYLTLLNEDLDKLDI